MYKIWGWDVWAACVGWGVLAEGGMGGGVCYLQLRYATAYGDGEVCLVDTWVV